MSSRKYKHKFQNAWLIDERFLRVSKKLRMILTPHCAYFARRAFLLESHMKGEKHKQETPPGPAASKQKTDVSINQ